MNLFRKEKPVKLILLIFSEPLNYFYVQIDGSPLVATITKDLKETYRNFDIICEHESGKKLQAHTILKEAHL